MTTGMSAALTFFTSGSMISCGRFRRRSFSFSLTVSSVSLGASLPQNLMPMIEIPPSDCDEMVRTSSISSSFSSIGFVTSLSTLLALAPG